MKTKLILCFAFCTILFANLTFYADLQRNIHAFETSQDALKKTLTTQVNTIQASENSDGLKTIVERLDNLEKENASLKEDYRQWSEEWKKCFEPMQKEYEGRNGK